MPGNSYKDTAGQTALENLFGALKSAQQANQFQSEQQGINTRAKQENALRIMLQGRQLEGEGQRQQAGFQHEKEMLPLREETAEKQKSFESNLGEQTEVRKEQRGEEEATRNLERVTNTAQKANAGRGPFGGKASVSLTPGGGASITEQEPGMAAMYGKMGEEANHFNKAADTALKPVADALQASKATLDGLDLNSPQGYKAAMINEARLVAGNSRGLSYLVGMMGGKPTGAESFNDVLNYINNTNENTINQQKMNQLREYVIQRHNSNAQLYNNLKTQISGRVDQSAPMNSTIAPGGKNKLLNDTFSPYESQFKEIGDRNAQYLQSKAQQNQPQGQPGTITQQPNYSQPQSTLDKLKGFFHMGGQQSQPTPQQVAPQSPSPIQPGQNQRSVVKTEVSPSTGKKRVTYNDGSQEIM